MMRTSDTSAFCTRMPRTVATYRGRALFTIDTGTFWVSRAVVHGAGFPLALVLGPVAGALALLLLGLALRRRIRPLAVRLSTSMLR